MIDETGYPRTPGIETATKRVVSALERGEKLAAGGAPATFYVCAIETKHIEQWRLYRDRDAAYGHLEQTAIDAYVNAGHILKDDDFDVVKWFRNRDSTHLATIQELTVEG